MIDKLHSHQIIGVDFDGTLIENGSSAIALWKFIREHHKTKQFHIVTFRSHGFQNYVFQDLINESRFNKAEPPTADMFAAVHNIADGVYTKFRIWEQMRERGQYSGPLKPEEIEWLTYKGRVCAQIGATCLIDDMEEYVKLGCELHGIEFVQAQTLTGPKIDPVITLDLDANDL